jgi:hypothetical protein
VHKTALSALVDTYAGEAALHGEATRRGDHRAVNRHHDKLYVAYRELRALGREAQEALLPLLSNHDLFVSAWTAAHALEFAPALGEAARERIEAGPPSI